MDLNLASLKNLSSVPASDKTAKNTLSSPTTSPLHETTSEASQTVDTTQDSLHKELTPVGQKISLMNLKKVSWTNNQEVPAETYAQQETPAQDTASPEKQEQKRKISLSSTGKSASQKEDVESLNQAETITVTSSTEMEPIEEAMQDREESRSVVFGEEVQKSENIKQEGTEAGETKEFFPNFRISDGMDLDKDLLNLQDVIPIAEHPESVMSQESLIISNQEALSSNTAVTPEYIAEVKTELSEGRRAGFRFLVQKKAKIIAGIGLIVLSISAITLFSGSLLSNNIQKSGKSTVQEAMKDRDTLSTKESEHVSMEQTSAVVPTTTPNSATKPAVIGPDYEIGVDYSVTKNTKKNIQHRTSSNAVPETKIPTLQKDLAK